MKIHEYQAKELFAKHGVPVLRGRLAHDADGAAKAFDELGSKVAVVKAQVMPNAFQKSWSEPFTRYA